MGLAIAAVAALLFLVLARHFAGLQNVWIDESTQLSGSALPFARMFAWLAGHYEPLGVPGDRMPPVSYALDALCGRTVCGGVIAYRWLHMIVTAAGIAGLVLLVARRYGWAGAVVSGAFLALTPQMLATGIEIRAYPIFFAVTVLQLWLLFGLIEAEALSWRRLLPFALAGVLALYTHFFGIVSSSALFTGLIAARARSWETLIRIGIAWALVLASAAGIAPFVMGASAISQGVENAGPPGLHDLLLFAARVVGHSSMMLHPLLMVGFALALAALLLIALIRLAPPVLRALRAVADPAVAVFVALAAGLTVTVLAAFVIHGFNPLKTSYSIWMLPLIALLIGAACAGRWRVPAMAAGALLIAALVPMTAQFEAHGDWFVHGPERAIGEQIDAPGRTAIVYIDDNWPYGFFPLVYRYHGQLAQYSLWPDGKLRRIGMGGDPHTPPLSPAELRRYDRLLLVGIELTTYHELRAVDEGAVDSTPPPSGDLLGPAAGGWNSLNTVIRSGVYWLRMTRLQRTDAP